LDDDCDMAQAFENPRRNRTAPWTSRVQLTPREAFAQLPATLSRSPLPARPILGRQPRIWVRLRPAASA